MTFLFFCEEGYYIEDDLAGLLHALKIGFPCANMVVFAHGTWLMVRLWHKAGVAALGLSCSACFELPNSVYFGSVAQQNGITLSPRIICPNHNVE